MLQEIFELVKGTATKTVAQNPAVPDNQNDEVVAEATNTVASGLRNIVAGGGVQSLLGLFGGNTDKRNLLGNPIVSMMMGHFAGKLMNKFGMEPSQANQLSGTLIPDALGNLISKTNDPSEPAFSLESLIASITGKKDAQGGGIGDLLSQISGGGTTQSGGGMMDMIKELAGGAQQQQRTNGGSLLDLIKGFTR